MRYIVNWLRQGIQTLLSFNNEMQLLLSYQINQLSSAGCLRVCATPGLGQFFWVWPNLCFESLSFFPSVVVTCMVTNPAKNRPCYSQLKNQNLVCNITSNNKNPKLDISNIHTNNDIYIATSLFIRYTSIYELN